MTLSYFFFILYTKEKSCLFILIWFYFVRLFCRQFVSIRKIQDLFTSKRKTIHTVDNNKKFKIQSACWHRCRNIMMSWLQDGNLSHIFDGIYAPWMHWLIFTWVSNEQNSHRIEWNEIIYLFIFVSLDFFLLQIFISFKILIYFKLIFILSYFVNAWTKARRNNRQSYTETVWN